MAGIVRPFLQRDFVLELRRWSTFFSPYITLNQKTSFLGRFHWKFSGKLFLPTQKTEEKRTIQNSDGSRSDIVTRRMGSKEISTTTTTDRDGRTEVVENMVNMSEDEREDFESSWNAAGPRRNISTHEALMRGDYPAPTGEERLPTAPMLDPHAPGIFSKLFGSWFK